MEIMTKKEAKQLFIKKYYEAKECSLSEYALKQFIKRERLFQEYIKGNKDASKHVGRDAFKAFYPLPACISKLSNTNSLTASIVLYIGLKGWQAERINNMGVYQKGKEYTDVMGKRRQTKGVYRKSTGTKGTSDISATIEGKSVKIEVKNAKTKDNLSPAQKKYKEQIEITGGIYYIATNFEETIHWIEENFKDNPHKRKTKMYKNV